MQFLKDIGGFILTPLYFLVSAVLLFWHGVFEPIAGSASWALGIIGLTLTIRAAKAEPSLAAHDMAPRDYRDPEVLLVGRSGIHELLPGSNAWVLLVQILH